MTTAADLDKDKIEKLEAELDPEMRFRPLLPIAAWIVAVALFGLSCFHYYTAGFGLLPETLHRGIHIACVLGLIFLVFSWNQKGNAAPPEAELLRRSASASIDWLLLHRGRRLQPLRPLRLPRSPVPRRQSRPGRLDHGHHHDRGAAGGDAPQRRLAAADHRGRADRVRALRPFVAGHSGASRQHLEKRRQSPLPDQPGHLRHRARRGRNLRLPLRAVRRACDARRVSAASSSISRPR